MDERLKQTPENEKTRSLVINEAGSMAISHSVSGQESAPAHSQRQRGHRILAPVLATHELMYGTGNPAGFSPGGTRKDISELVSVLREPRSGTPQQAFPEADRVAIEALSPHSAHARVIPQQPK